MAGKLVIFTPKIGAGSETFIKCHIDQLLPGQTVVVAGSRANAQWSVKCPSLILDELPAPKFRRQLFRACLEKAGRRCEAPETLAVKQFLRQHKVTVAMGEYLNASLPWMEVCQSLGIRFVGHAHGYDVSQLLRHESWREAYCKYRGAYGLVVVNQVQCDRLTGLGLDKHKIRVIPCGVEVADMPPDHQKNGGAIQCLTVGRMVPKKAPIMCLDAFRRAAAVVPELRLQYVGTGEQFGSARHYVRAFKLEDKVDLMGGQSHAVVHELMKRADIYIQHCMTDQDTGDEEGLPVAILEAMAHGLPVVSTRHAGIPEAVIDQETGLLVDEGENEGMADCIVKLAHDRALRIRMGCAGYERAKEKFSLEVERSHLLDVMGLAKA